jgi:hypothetical protein
MDTKKYVNENFEYNARKAVISFLNIIRKVKTPSGEQANIITKGVARQIGETIVNYVKEGHVRNVEEALNYNFEKYDIVLAGNEEEYFKMMDIKNDTIKELNKYNNGTNTITNVNENFNFIMKNKDSPLLYETINITFSEADGLFDRAKQESYPLILLNEGNVTIRKCEQNQLEERTRRYDALNGPEKPDTELSKITHQDVTVQTSYVYHQDSGHGWLAVPIQELRDLGIAERITSWSYINKETAFLEEDLDLGTFLEMRSKVNLNVQLIDRYVDGLCDIRNYPSYDSAKEKAIQVRAMSLEKQTGVNSRITKKAPEKKIKREKDTGRER